MLNRIEELEKLVAASDATKQTSTNISSRSNKGLSNTAVNENSVLVDSGKSTIGGQVYGPDGSVYPSVTAAIQAGVYNFTYFPISTGIRQENAPLTKRMVSVPTESAPNNNTNFLSMGNQVANPLVYDIRDYNNALNRFRQAQRAYNQRIDEYNKTLAFDKQGRTLVKKKSLDKVYAVTDEGTLERTGLPEGTNINDYNYSSLPDSNRFLLMGRRTLSKKRFVS